MGKNTLGQYFTKNNELKEKMFEFILNDPNNILEPCIGEGDLVEFVRDKRPMVIFDMYEIDDKLKISDKIQRDDVIYGDFITQNVSKKYQTIIGNPPYVKTKKGNLYIDFAEKCYDLLDNNGELIFIVPADFLKLTSCSKLLNKMMTTGTFTHIFHPHNEKMFDNACIDIVIFRYCKNETIEKTVLYNDKQMCVDNTNGLVTFWDKENEGIIFTEYFEIYVGMVTGKESVFKNDAYGNIEVLNGEDKCDKYIFTENFPSGDDDIDRHLLEHKPELIARKIRNFGEDNWFEWGAPRNIAAIRSNFDEECIYIYNLTRKKNVAFLGKVNYFGGGLIMLIPKKSCNIANIVSYMNSNIFKNNFMYSGRFKIGHRQISNSRIPVEHL